MKIVLNNAGKRFNRDWIFRGMDKILESNSKTVVLGGNGSGKSTFLKVLSGYYSLNEGEVLHSVEENAITPEKIYTQISYAAPYIDLAGLFNLRETLKFHFELRSPINDLSIDDLIARSGLAAHKEKALKNYSSGMKQRVKLLLAICTESSLLLLDEPSTNLDDAGISWYNQLLAEHADDRTIVIASNHTKEEYEICEAQIEMSQFKN